MNKSYYRSSHMVEGAPFKCINCNKTLMNRISGSVYELELKCPRCKAELTVKCNEPIPYDQWKHAEVNK